MASTPAKMLDTLGGKRRDGHRGRHRHADASLVYAGDFDRAQDWCLPVVENGRLVGILTEGDFVALVARNG